VIAGAGQEVTGVVVAVCSAALYDAGYVLEKRALDELPALRLHPVHLVQTVIRSRQWVAGFGMICAGLVLQVIAFTLAPVSVVQPILSAGLVGLVAVAGPLLGERPGRRHGAGLSLVLISVLAVALSTGGATAVAERAPLSRLIALAVPVAVVGGYLTRLGHRSRHASLVASALGAGLLYGLAAVAEKAAATQLVRHGLVDGSVVALRTAYPWMLLAATAGGMLAFQVGLQRHPASTMAPLTNVSGAVCALIGASVVFGERLLPPGGWALARLAGFAALLGAIWFLVGERPQVEVTAVDT
jgi:drug/metabolite transporter (DMT)-like permease